jgi:3-hydroxyisobutyrate dehydrogenase
MERIGFIGTGIMGLPMARNLLKSGYNLTVHNRTQQKTQPLIDEGAKWADSPMETAVVSDILITCVNDTPNVQEVLLGEKGVIYAAHNGLICVDMSTISPTATKEMAEILNIKSVTLLDAPVSGGESGAINGHLSIMMGGPKEAFEKIKPIMMVMGKNVTWCGLVGSGQMTKLANQIMVIHTLMSMAEGLVFAEKAGLDLETTWNVTRAGAAGSHSLSVLGRKAIDGDFKPAFMVDLQLKDLRLITEYAGRIGQPLPGTALVHELLKILQAHGRGRDGTQSLFEVIRELGR